MQNQTNALDQDFKAKRRSSLDIATWRQQSLLPLQNQNMSVYKQQILDNWLQTTEDAATVNGEQPMKQSTPFSPFSQQVVHNKQVVEADETSHLMARFDSLAIANVPQANNGGPCSRVRGRALPPNPFQPNYGVDWSGYDNHIHLQPDAWRPSQVTNGGLPINLLTNHTGFSTPVGQRAQSIPVDTGMSNTFSLSHNALSHGTSLGLSFPVTSGALLSDAQQLHDSSLPTTTTAVTTLNTTMAEKTTWSKVVKGVSLSEISLDDQSSSTGPSNNTSVRYITDSISYMTSKLQAEYSPQKRYNVVKVTNFPWEVNASIIKQIFKQSSNFSLPSELPQCVHIMMDTKSGKTLGIAFVEVIHKLKSKQEIMSALKSLSISCVQTPRRPQFTLSSYDELCSHIFPNWKGQFIDGLAVAQPYPKTVYNMMVDTSKSSFFISQKELQTLLNICRNYKVNYNRRCSERPFEYLISIVMHMPWNQAKTVTTTQRDILYECYKLATVSLYEHTNRKMHSFESDILLRFVRAGLLCDGFTYKQKNDFLHHAHMECPEDLKSYVEAPAILNNSEFTTLLRL